MPRAVMGKELSYEELVLKAENDPDPLKKCKYSLHLAIVRVMAEHTEALMEANSSVGDVLDIIVAGTAAGFFSVCYQAIDGVAPIPETIGETTGDFIKTVGEYLQISESITPINRTMQ